MKNFIIAFFAFLLWSIFGMWYHSCIIKELCNDTAIDKNLPTKIKPVLNNNSPSKSFLKKEQNPLILKNKSGSILFKFPNNLEIKANDYTISFPEGDKLFKTSVFKFLNNNQNKELLIIGLYNSNETNNNGIIGINRANYVKALLVKFGINADRVSVTNKLKEFDYDINGNYKGGILFSFIDLTEDKLKTIERGISNKTLYSGFGSKGFAPDNTLQAYALELKSYLNKYPNKLANIIGHTDSVGDLEANDWYGMERSKNVKRYLESQGIDGSRLITSSKGETEPIDSNGTLEGRRKNRRIEIKVN